MLFGNDKSALAGFLRGAVYVFIALFPVLLYSGYLFNGTSTRSVNLILLVEVAVVLVAIAMFSKKTRLVAVFSPVVAALFLLLISLTISSIAGIDLHTSFWSKATRSTGLFYFIHLGLFIALCAGLFRDERHRLTLVKTFVYSAAITSIGSLLGKEGFGFLFTGKPWEGFTFGNSTFAAMYLYAALMFALYLAYTQKKKRWWHWLLPVVLAINPYLFNFDVWRGAVNLLQHPLSIVGSAQATSLTMWTSLIALACFLIVSKFQSRAVRRTILFGTVGVGIIAAAFAAYSFLSPGGTLQSLYLRTANGARPIVWNLSKGAISEKPLLGWGVDNFESVFQAHYDNRIMEQANGGEAWFDRAHNIFIDQAIESGYIGVGVYVLVYLVLLGVLLWVIVRSTERNRQALAAILLVYFAGHLLELQTAFDTTISYVPLAIAATITALIFFDTQSEVGIQQIQWRVPEPLQIVAALVLIAGMSLLFVVGTVPIIKAEAVNGTIRTAGSSTKRLPFYATLFGSPLDINTFLWRTSRDIQRGISLKPSVVESPENKQAFAKEFDVLVSKYKEYLGRNPTDYRASLNLADIYIYERLMNVDRLDDAHAVLDRAVANVPQAPQAYWMQAVAYLYQRKFDLARQWADKALAINPSIEESQRLRSYIDRSIKTFPVIDLYSFRQI